MLVILKLYDEKTIQNNNLNTIYYIYFVEYSTFKQQYNITKYR